MSYCSDCGTELKDDVKFCPSCGKKQTHEVKKVADVSEKAAAENQPVIPDTNVSRFYKIDYSLVAFIIWSVAMLGSYLTGLSYDQYRFMSNFPYFIIGCSMALICAIMHLILRRKDKYVYKGKLLAILLIIMLVLTPSLQIFGSRMMVFGCQEEFRYGADCNLPESRFDGYECVHYSYAGFGSCDRCVKTVCQVEDNI